MTFYIYQHTEILFGVIEYQPGLQNKKQDKPIFDSIAFTMLSLQVSLCLYCGVIQYIISNQYSTCRQLNFVDISIVERVSVK